MKARGFTILELLIVLFLIGVLAAIASPSFVGFWQRQRVRVAVGSVYEAFSLARSNAVTQKVDYSVDFRRDADGFSDCVRRSLSRCCGWQLFMGVYSACCRFPSEGQDIRTHKADFWGVCTASFWWMGAVKGRLGGVYLKPKADSWLCRGVWTKTLLSVLDSCEIDRCEE